MKLINLMGLVIFCSIMSVFNSFGQTDSTAYVNIRVLHDETLVKEFVVVDILMIGSNSGNYVRKAATVYRKGEVKIELPEGEYYLQIEYKGVPLISNFYVANGYVTFIDFRYCSKKYIIKNREKNLGCDCVFDN